MKPTHEDLLKVMVHKYMDYTPWGSIERKVEDGDCSHGCKHGIELPGKLGADWVVCCNPKSHRCGLLTFEHQGCRGFK